MKKFIIITLLAIIVNFYFFPVSFNHLPESLNSKKIIAFFGIAAFVYDCIRRHAVILSKRTGFAALLAAVFSVWCLFVITVNGTNDTTYVEYWTSFLTWMGGAYGVYCLLRAFHGRADLPLITKYLTIICLAQCAIALMIDNIPAVRSAVQLIFYQGYDFYERIGRLYGIGCALDVAGVRFSGVLLLIAHQIARNPDVSGKKREVTKKIVAFLLITVVGSMIARTTLIGAGLALFYILVSLAQLQQGGVVSRRQIRVITLLVLIVSALTFLATYLYNTNADVRENLRFAFEGFFNWAETGEFRTDSTDILETMWIWPQTTHDWIIGTGRISVFVWGTDIGYCNFVLYCGLIGLIIFSAFFIYCNLSLNGKYKDFFLVSLLLIALQGIVWTKVMTDIFVVDALLLCADGDKHLSEIKAK